MQQITIDYYDGGVSKQDALEADYITAYSSNDFYRVELYDGKEEITEDDGHRVATYKKHVSAMYPTHSVVKVIISR